METETMIRIGAIVVATILLFTNVNTSAWLEKIKNAFKVKKRVIVDIDENDKDEVKDKPFLEIIDLWYSLREKCTKEGLDQAVEKLDEVFPLFNSEE